MPIYCNSEFILQALSSVFCVPKCKKGNGLQYLRRHIRVELSSDEENNKNTTSEKTYSLFLF